MAETQTKEITVKLNKPQLKKGSKIDLSKAVKMRLNGRSYQEIADAFKCNKSAVHQALSKWCPDAMDVNTYRENEGDLITALKSRILNGITNEKISDMNAYQLSTMFGIMVDKSRLIEGKSTANIESVINSAMDLANEKDGI